VKDWKGWRKDGRKDGRKQGRKQGERRTEGGKGKKTEESLRSEKWTIYCRKSFFSPRFTFMHIPYDARSPNLFFRPSLPPSPYLTFYLFIFIFYFSQGGRTDSLVAALSQVQVMDARDKVPAAENEIFGT
jgi:hypothetical protein